MKIWSIIVWSLAASAAAQEYSTCETWDELVQGKNVRYAPVVRVSDPGTKDRPVYTGFWFYDEQQFDVSGRFALGMKVHFQERDVEQSDRGDIGYVDLKDGFKWTKIGETTAWNWQQGCRLQWRPNSEEILSRWVPVAVPVPVEVEEREPPVWVSRYTGLPAVEVH